MKFLFASVALLALSIATPVASARASVPAPPTDTIVVRLPNQVVMTLRVRDAQQLRQLPQYHLDSLVARLGTYVARANAAAQKSAADRVTVQYYPNQDQPGQGLPEAVRITTRKATATSPGPSTRAEALLEKRLGVVVNLDGHDDDKRPRADATPEQRQAHRDSLRLSKLSDGSSTDFRFDLGLNAFVNKKPYATAPGLEAGNLELRPEGSRYVNLGFNYIQRLGGKGSPVYLSLGPEFAFNNYMLRGNNKWVNANDRTEIVLDKSGRNYQKTKLATTTLNLPLMLMLKLHDRHGKPTITLGGGGFAGYLLNQHTKLKYFEDGETHKDKDHGSYNLSDFQYGLQGVVGFGGFTLFAKYNMNELFKENRGPQTQVLSFGVVLSGI